MGTHPIFESDFDCLAEICRVEESQPPATGLSFSERLLPETRSSWLPSRSSLTSSPETTSRPPPSTEPSTGTTTRAPSRTRLSSLTSRQSSNPPRSQSPSDDGQQAALEGKAAEDEVAVANYIKKDDQQIDEASVTLNNIKALPPFEQMTQSDILYWFPQLCKNQEP